MNISNLHDIFIYMEKNRTCCFIGHRKINLDINSKNRLVKIIEDLIVNKNVINFLFGSRSEFNDICYKIVSELKEKYMNIVRIFYTSKSESCLFFYEKEKWEQRYKVKLKKEIPQFFEKEVEHKTKNQAGRASYIERNYAMIDDSDLCVIYYKENYSPSIKYNCRQIFSRKSGTRVALNYIKQKKKEYINVAI